MCPSRPPGAPGSPGLSGHRPRGHAAPGMLRRLCWAQQRVNRQSSPQGALCFHAGAQIDWLFRVLFWDGVICRFLTS